MGQALLQQLPDDLVSGWLPAWTASTIPFHNGQILETADAAWISVHSLKALLRRDGGWDQASERGRVEPEVAAAYLEAARRAATELETLLAKPVRFVHPMDDGGEAADAFSWILGGAAFDLDSLLTVLPGDPPRALVGDPTAGSDLVAAAGAAELEELARAFGTRPRGEELRHELLAAQRDDEALALQGFVDSIAARLAADSIQVTRLPLVRLPPALLAEPRSGRDFLMSWNNVTLERTVEGWRAEGFAAPLASGNEDARAAFARAGFRLDLLPPLYESVMRNGGYRCASNHLREAPAALTAEHGATRRGSS